MKFFAALLALSLAFISPAEAAQKKVAVKKIEKIAILPTAELLVASGSSIITIGNIESTTSDISLSALSSDGTPVWNLLLDTGLDEIVMAATADNSGNLWLAGFSATAVVAESATATVTAENPDSVPVEPSQPVRSDLNRLTLWKIDSAGQLSATYYSSENLPGIINAISASRSGVSIVGQYNQRSFIQNMTSTGSFGKLTYIGTSKTSLNSIVRNSDGSTSVFGTSIETIGIKRLAAKRDGVLIKVSKSGAITNVVRSSAINAERSWLSADSNFLLSGYVKTGKKVETAITKFTPAFAPLWTLRVPSTGESTAITAGKSSVVAISSKSQVSSIIGWKPTKPSLLLLTFNTKGLITSASGATDLIAPIALSYSKEVGIVGLARNSESSAVLFKLSK
jgi:hypothetical protein